MGISCVQWNMFDAGHQTDWQGTGEIKIRRLGYFWWMYNGYCGELEYIRFEKQIFLPKANFVDGWGWELFPGVHGDFHVTWTKLAELPVEVIGQAISLAAGKIGGLGNLNKDGIIQAPSQIMKQGTNTRLKGYISSGGR